MEQRNDAGSILLSRILVWVFGALILVLDWAVWPLSQVLMRVLPVFDGGDAVLLKVCLYVCNVPGFILLYCMDVLLRNLHRGQVFESKNVRLLKVISVCCFIACVVCLAACPQIYSLGFVALAAGFMGLIVRIVKNVFAKAIPMRDELDLTV